MGDHTLSTSRGVVERLDHHCADDLVYDLVTEAVVQYNINLLILPTSLFWISAYFG